MSYATIEEAWGGLGPAPEEETPVPRIAPVSRPRRRVAKPRPKPRPRGPKPVVIHGQDPPMFRDGQAFVQAVYAKYGVGGIKELLGKDISSRLCGHRRKNARKDDLWSLHGPMTFEKTLLILAVLFGGAMVLNALFKPSSVGGSPPPW